MKTCPKCNASMPDDVNFCTECGTKMSEPQEQTKFCISCGAKIPYEAQFCPECAAKQVVEEKKKIDLYESITKPEISFQAGYGHNYVAAGAGGLTISLLGISYESNLKSVSAVLSLIGTLGQKTRISISFKDITAIGIQEKGRTVVVAVKDGTHHVFGSPFGTDTQVAKKIAYLIELYRRMYWYYGEYVDHPYLRQIVPIGYFKDAPRVDNLSNEELINFYHTLY